MPDRAIWVTQERHEELKRVAKRRGMSLRAMVDLAWDLVLRPPVPHSDTPCECRKNTHG